MKQSGARWYHQRSSISMKSFITVEKLSIIVIVLLGAFLYTLTIRGEMGNPVAADFRDNLDLPTRAFELSPERGRFTHVIALAENNTYALGEDLRDVALPDVGYFDGQYFSYFAPGIPYLSYPFYELGAPFDLGQVATFAFVSVMSILSMIFLFKIAREIMKFPIWVSLMTVISFAFASTAWSYAITLYQHHLTAFFILSSFYAVWRYERSGRFGFFWTLFVWINYGLAISIDYPNAVLMLPVMIYLLVTTVKLRFTEETVSTTIRFGAIFTILAFIGVMGLHAYHNNFYFNSPTKLSSTIIGYKTIEQQELSETENPEEFAAVESSKTVQSFFTEENVPRGLYTLTISEDRGLFFYTPLFLFALLGLYYMIKRGITKEEGFLLGIVGVNFLVYTSWGDPWGGWAYGPRYLIPSMGIFSILTWYGVWHFGKPMVSKILAFILFVYSSAIALLGALTTNAVPPKSEGIFFDVKYNFVRNFDLLIEGKSGSFLYNEFIGTTVSLQLYYLVILAFVVAIAALIIFILPKFEYDHNY